MSDRRITREVDRLRVGDPLERGTGDPYAAFRDVQRLSLELRFGFTHSLGKLSRFFEALEDRMLLATVCERCGRVWMPPRVHCPEDLSVTRWQELPGHGVLEAGTVSAYALGTGAAPEMLGYVRLEGADSALLQRLRGIDDLRDLEPGLPVRVAWSETAVAHPMDLFWFEPA